MSAFYLDGEDLKRSRTGRTVVCPNTRGLYIYVANNPKLYIGYHRVKFCVAHGYLPTEVDHKDRDRRNNKLSNLRPTDHSQNMRNRRAKRRSLPRGVFRSGRRYRAMVQIQGQLRHLGMFDDAEAASRAVEEILRAEHGEFYCLQATRPLSPHRRTGLSGACP